MQPGYIEEQKERALRNSRIAAVFAAVAIMVFALLDMVVYPDFMYRFLILRISVVGVSAILYAITYIPRAADFGREIGMVQYVITALSVVVMIHMADGYLSTYYAGLNIIFIVFLAILPLDHIRTTVICSVIYAAYLIPILLHGQIDDWAIFVNNNAFLLGTILLAVVSSYFSNRLRRKEYIARYNLARANDELKQMDLLKSQFFANISHEVRTPLTSIIGPVQSLYQGEAGEVNDIQRQLLSQVYRNGVRLLDMINQMLDFARFDANKMQVRLSEVDLDTVIQDIISVFLEVAARKSLTITYELETDIFPVYLDKEKADRIITNLLRNAIKFTDRGGITIRAGSNGDTVYIEIEDTGIGIPGDQVSTIFERFQQVDSSSTRRYEGTGLGLTIVKEAVEIQRGSVDVRSVYGEGTTFTVTFPCDLHEQMPNAVGAPVAKERRRGDRRKGNGAYTGPERRRGPRRQLDFARVDIADMVMIDSGLYGFDEEDEESIADRDDDRERTIVLYVEDNVDLRRYVYTMLSRSGYRVVTAADGRDGWDKLQDLHPDVVVSDVMMPRLDGYDLMKRMRSSDELCTIPIILTTAKSETEERIKGLEHGADDYLAKPINIRELDARIRNLITRRLFQEAVAKAEMLERRMQDITLGFSRSLDLRDPYTANHSKDVLFFGTIIADELGYTVDETFRDALLLHDIGKIGIPDRILLKEGPLNDDEWTLMKRHAEFGAQLLAEI